MLTANNFKINLVFINLVIFVIFPFSLANSLDYKYEIYTLISIFLIFAASSTLSIILFIILKKILTNLIKKNNFYLEILVKFLLFWIFLTGIFFPVTGDHDPFLNLSLSISKKYEILIKIFLILLLFYFLEKKKLSDFVFRFIFIYVIINLILISSKINLKKQNNFNSKINQFGKQNLIILSFDGLTGVKMFEEIEKNIELKDTIKDFIFYKNVTTAWPFTGGSINSEINGQFIEDMTALDYKNFLNDENLDVAVYASYGSMVLNKKNTLKKGKYKNYSGSYKLNKFIQIYFTGSIGRWATPIAISFIDPIFYNKTYKKFIDFISFGNKDKINPFNKINNEFFVDLYEYDLIFDEILFNENLKNTVRAYHFTFPHWPVLVDENCNEIKYLDNEISHYHESILINCVSKKIIKFIKQLKKNNLYDNSMIVIKSDHGKPNFIQKKYSENIFQIFNKRLDKYYDQYPYNLQINDSFYWGYGRYKPFIMIKDKNMNNNILEVRKKHVFLHDLSTTYCNFYYKDESCKKFKRNNLAASENLFQEYIYDIYLPKNKNSFSRISDFTKHEISNSTSLIDFLNLSGINVK